MLYLDVLSHCAQHHASPEMKFSIYGSNSCSEMNQSYQHNTKKPQCHHLSYRLEC